MAMLGLCEGFASWKHYLQSIGTGIRFHAAILALQQLGDGTLDIGTYILQMYMYMYVCVCVHIQVYIYQ
jgi:hypothetical protein